MSLICLTVDLSQQHLLWVSFRHNSGLINETIISKTDAGEYSYHSQKVHAVESIEPTELLSFSGDQRISYNYMNLPIYIANDEDSLVYTYGVGNKRIKAMQYSGGQLVRTTWYGDNFERVVEGSTEKFYHWIQSPDGPVALVIKVTGGATTIYYLCTDHLNSITGIMDASGNMQEEYSFDPWGRRRSPVSWSTDSVTAPVITTRGYTGHEHLDAFGLIHMNGRIYDPHLARVLNPDPIIQDSTDIQNYNRYSYCFNNPLNYTDPSGYISYKQSMDNTYGEGNYYYRGRGPKLLSFGEYMSSGNGGSGGVGGPFGLPYQGNNGSGDLGFYFDYYSMTCRNTETGTQMPNITHLVYTYGPNLPTIFRGVLFQNGTSWYTEDGPYPSGQGGITGLSFEEVAADIRNGGVDRFVQYLKDKNYGGCFFIKAADNYSPANLMHWKLAPQSINYGRKVGRWGHQYFPNPDYGELRHIIGSYVIAEKYDPITAWNVTWGNEYIGLGLDIRNIRSRLNGAEWAFQFSDVNRNYQGIWYSIIY